MKNILLVDDSEENCLLIAVWLNLKGYYVTSVHNGQEALDYLKDNKADVMFLDIDMPVMDGNQVIQTLKEQGTIDDQYIVMLTACKDNNIILSCLRNGARDFIGKPFKKDSVFDALEKYESTLLG